MAATTNPRVNYIAGDRTIRTLDPHIEQREECEDNTRDTLGVNYSPLRILAIFFPPQSCQSTHYGKDRNIYDVEHNKFLLNSLEAFIIEMFGSLIPL